MGFNAGKQASVELGVDLLDLVCVFQAEELIKREMLTMLHYDAVYTPTPAQQGVTPGTKKPAASQRAVLNQAQHLAYLESHPYHQVEQEELQAVSRTR